MKRQGYCPQCRTIHEVNVTGAGCGTLCTVALAVARRSPVAALALVGVGLIWGDRIEAWFTAHCPGCRTALTLLAKAT